MNPKENIIQNKTFDFSLKIISICKILKQHHEFEISKQLIPSGTSIGSNVHEAGAGQTKKDFISKMEIASKEARETKYWLRILEASNIIAYDYASLLKECDEIINILTAIVKTSQINLTKQSTVI